MANIPNIGYLSGNEKMPEVIDHVAKLQKMVEFLATGNLSSVNAREFGGWRVAQTELRSLDGDVGMSTADDGADPVRLWAGSTSKESAPWRVYASGKSVMTGALIQSNDTYPKVVIDPDNDIIAAYASANQYIRIGAFGTGSVPYIEFRDVTASLSAIINLGSFLQIQSSNRFDILSVAGDINLQASSGSIRLQSTTRVAFSSLIDTIAGTSLSSQLAAKVNGSGINGSVYVATTPGGSPTQAITFSNGVRIA